MLDILASSFMTATRSGGVPMREVPSKNTSTRRRWFSTRKTRCIDPNKF